MTVAADEAKAGPFTGNDVTTAFPFSFTVFADTDVRVVETVIATGVETDLVLNTNYTVARNANQDDSPGGTITYKNGGVTTPLPSTKKLTVVGNFTYEQPTDIPNGGSFFANIIEKAFDRIEMQVKQLKEAIDRAVKVNVSSSTDPDELVAELIDASAAAVAAYDSFDDRYLGAKASDPSFDNDGAALIVGALYWNTSIDAMRVYDGAQWGPATAAGTYEVITRSGDGVTTNFALPISPVSKNNVFVHINTAYQFKSEFSVAGTTLTFTSPPPAGTDNIEIVIAVPLPITSASADNVTYTCPGTGAVQTDLKAMSDDYVSVFMFMTDAQVADVQSKAATVDITTAANNALKYIRGNLTGKKLVFPYGTYLTTGLTCYPDSHIYFEPGATLKMSADGVGIKTRNSTAQTYVTDNVRRVTIENYQCDMNSHEGFGLLLEGVTHANIICPKIVNVGSGSYTYNDGVGNDSYNSIGIVLKGVHGVRGAYYNRIINPRVEGISTAGGGGIYLGTTVSGDSQRANFNYIELPVCQNLYLGVEINIGGDNVIVQPECSGNTVGIRVGRASGTYDAVRNTIRRPYLENCSSVGILLRALATDTVIDGFGSTGGTTTPYTDNGVNTTIFAGNKDSIATTGYARFYKGSIRFSPAVANTDKDTNANALDDYEEGTFTPAISGSTSAGTGTYTVQYGAYTLIGDRCFFLAYLLWTAHTGTGSMRITGLPFTAESGNNIHPLATYNTDITLTASHVLQAYVQSNQARVDVLSYPTGGGAAANVAMDTAATLIVSGHYKVNH